MGRGLQWLPVPHQYKPTASLAEDREVPEGWDPTLPVVQPQAAEGDCSPEMAWGLQGLTERMPSMMQPCPVLLAHLDTPHRAPWPLSPRPEAFTLSAPASLSPGPGHLPPPCTDESLGPRLVPVLTPHLISCSCGALPPSQLCACTAGEEIISSPDARQGLAPASLQLPGLISPQALSQGTFCDSGHVQHGTTSHVQPLMAQVWRKTRLQPHLV